MAVGINIVTDFDSKGISKAITEFKKLETTGEKASFVLKKAFLPAVAVLGGLAIAGFKAAEAAAQDELEQAKLAQTLQNVLGATNGVIASTETMIAAMSRASGTADTELRSALSSLVIGTKDLTKAEEGLALAQDIATASNLPLQSAADALSKAYSGNYKALQKLSPALRDLIKDGASTEVIFADLANTFGGATANAADTAAGKMKIFKNNMAELQESLGAALLPVLEKMTEIFTVVFGLMENNQTTVLVLAGIIGTLALAIVAYNIALKVATIAHIAFGASATVAAGAAAPIAAMAAGIMLAVIAVIAIVAALVYAYKNIEGFRNAVNTAVNFIISAFEMLANFVIKVINKIIDGINILIKAANFFGAGIKPIGKIAEVSFGRVGVAVQMTEQQLKNLERQALNTSNAIRLVVTPEDQLKTQANRYTEMALSMGKLVDYTGKGYKQMTGGGGAVESATEKLQKYVDAIKGVTSAQRSLRDANKQVDESNKSLLEKTKALAEAQKRFNLITKGYGKDSKQAKDAENERSKAERTAERAKYALEEAIFAVKEAEQELAKIRLDPASTPQMIREAEIRLAQSKLSVADATDQQRDSSDALTAAQERLNVAVNGAEKGSEAYKDALDDLLSAEKAQADALDARTSAYERQADAVRDLTDAEKQRYEAGLAISKKAKAQADADESNGVVIPDIISGGGGGTGFDYGFGEVTLDDLKNIRVPSLEELLGGGIGVFANGGIVTKAMLGMVGEAGAEAIIPLDRMSSMGSTYNISVTAGMGADGKDIGTQIVNALKRYERTNGALPLTVA